MFTIKKLIFIISILLSIVFIFSCSTKDFDIKSVESELPFVLSPNDALNTYEIQLNTDKFTAIITAEIWEKAQLKNEYFLDNITDARTNGETFK